MYIEAESFLNLHFNFLKARKYVCHHFSKHVWGGKRLDFKNLKVVNIGRYLVKNSNATIGKILLQCS